MVAGQVVGLRKKGDSQMFVQIEDGRGRIECAFFGETYSEYAQLLVRDRLLVIQGGRDAVVAGAQRQWRIAYQPLTRQYRLSTGELTLVASTSDETTPPVLTAHTGNGTLIGNLGGTGAVKTLSMTLSPIPPAKVQVTSANGGSDSEDVVLVP